MLRPRPFALVCACALFPAAYPAARVEAAEGASGSTIRTISIAGPISQAVTTLTTQEPSRPTASEARFKRPAGGQAAKSNLVWNQPAASISSSSATRQSDSTMLSFKAHNDSISSPATSSESTSLVFVHPVLPARPAESSAVRTVQFEATIPDSPADGQSSITFETIASVEALAETPAAPIETGIGTLPAANAQPQTATAAAAASAAEPQATSPDARPPAPAPFNEQFVLEQLRQLRDASAAGTGIFASDRAAQRPSGHRGPSALPAKSKPFQGFESGPTVSPYLNLYRNEDDGESAPNYYAFVRPQVEQTEANRNQQIELQKLQRQLQSTTVVTPRYRGAVPSTTGAAARFMDTAQFFGGWPR